MPFVVNAETIWTEAGIDEFLAALSTRPAAALMPTPNIHLYTEPHLPNPVTDTPASFTEATFNGYAPLPLVTGTPQNNPGGGRMVQGDADWVLGSPAGGGATIYGAFTTDVTNATLWAILPLAEPAVLGVSGDPLNMDAVLQFLFNQTPAG